MELILQQGLPHQQKAIDAVCGALDGVTIIPPVTVFDKGIIINHNKNRANLH